MQGLTLEKIAWARVTSSYGLPRVSNNKGDLAPKIHRRILDPAALLLGDKSGQRFTKNSNLVTTRSIPSLRPHLFCARMTVDACARLSARWLDPVGWMLSSMVRAFLTASDASFLRPLAWYKLAPSSRLRATVGDRDGSADACKCIRST